MKNKKNFLKLIKISLTTNIFEWYEFVLFSYLSVIIGRVFFGSNSDLIAMMQGLFIFAASYIIRPLGSLFFGYVGDKYNTSVSLRYTTIIMSLPTFFIGLLPTYSQVGIVAPIILILLRLIQGFASGGELPVCASYVFSETYSSENRTFMCGLVNIGGMIGVLLASSTVFVVFYFFSDYEIQNWAWRIPFIISLPVVACNHKHECSFSLFVAKKCL